MSDPHDKTFNFPSPTETCITTRETRDGGSDAVAVQRSLDEATAAAAALAAPVSPQEQQRQVWRRAVIADIRAMRRQVPMAVAEGAVQGGFWAAVGLGAKALLLHLLGGK